MTKTWKPNLLTKIVTTLAILPMSIGPAPAQAFVIFGQWGGDGKATYQGSTPQEFCEAAKSDALESAVNLNRLSIIETFEARSAGNLHRHPDARSYGGEIKASCFFNFKYHGESGVEFGHLPYQVERLDGQDYMAHPAPVLGWARRA